MKILSSVIAVGVATSASASVAPRVAPDEFRTVQKYGEVIDSSGKVWGLKDAYDGVFKIGMSFMNSRLLKKDPTASIILDNSHVAIPETNMIWSEVEVADDDYDFSFVDSYVRYCNANNIEPIGHCLIWKGIGWMSSYPPNISDEERAQIYLTRMEDYIKTMMTRYGSKIKRWVVVNEWLDQEGGIRQDLLMPNTTGTNGFEQSFRWAMKYGDPNFNEFYVSENKMWYEPKYNGVVSYLNSLRNKGLKIDGIFLQGHQYYDEGDVKDATGNTTHHAAVSDYDRSIKHIGSNGYKVVLSELDITVLPDAWTCCRNTSIYDYPKSFQQTVNPFTKGMTQEVAEMQREKWNRMFDMLLDNREYVTDVHMWSVTDENSWYNKWPIQGRTDYPTLFDRKHQAKPQYYDILRKGPNPAPAGVDIPDLPTATK